jgi:glutaminyl-peptide cyclotransferase
MLGAAAAQPTALADRPACFYPMPSRLASISLDNQGMVRTYGVRVVRRVAHPGRGFTQGLLSEGETVWESVGTYGQSALLRYALPDGKSGGRSGTWGDPGETLDAQVKLAPEFFAEGICKVGDSIWQLTWKELIAFRWDAASLTLRDKVRFNREGWGMCAVADVGPSGELITREVVTSHGTSDLVRRDPDTLEQRDIVHVRCQGAQVRWLNDLTWADGLVWANVAGTDCLAGIDLAAGEVTDIVDAGAAAERHGRDPQAIMNGIAAMAGPGEFLLTGKTWRSIRHVRLVRRRGRGHVDRMLRGWQA